MRVFRVFGAVVVVVAACLFIFTDRGTAAMLLLLAGLALMSMDHYRVRARKAGGGAPR